MPVLTDRNQTCGILGAFELPGDLAGYMPLAEALHEECRIVGNEVLERFVQQIIDRLVTAAREDGEERISGVITPHISCAGGEWAFSIPGEQVNRIFVGKKAFELYESVDEFAFVIAHEIAHFIYRHNRSPDMDASVEEEIFADHLALELMEQAGYSCDGAALSFKRYLSDSQRGSSLPWLDEIRHLPDAHLNAVQRWAQVREDFPGMARIVEGDQEAGTSRPLTPINGVVQDEASCIHHTSFIADFADRTQISLQPWPVQLQLLHDVVPELTNHARRYDFFQLVTRLWSDHARFERPDLPDEGCEELLHSLIDRLLDDYYQSRDPSHIIPAEVYLQASKLLLVDIRGEQYIEGHGEPLGRLRYFEDLIRNVTVAETPEDRASLLTGYLDKRKELDPILPDASDISRSRKDVRIEWPHQYYEPLLRAAAQDATGAIALLVFDTYGHRVRVTDLLTHLPVPVLRAIAPIVSKGGRCDNFRQQVEAKARQERGTVDISGFRIDPATVYESYRDTLFPPPPEYARSYAAFGPGHPYHGRQPSEAQDLHTETCRKFVAEFDRMLATENPACVSQVRSFFLGKTDGQSAAYFAHTGNYGTVTHYSRNSPFVAFIETHPEIFSLEERFEALSNLGIQNQRLDWWSRVAHFRIPETVSELEDFVSTQSKISEVASEVIWDVIGRIASHKVERLRGGQVTDIEVQREDNARLLRLAQRAVYYETQLTYNQPRESLRRLVFPVEQPAPILPLSLPADDLVTLFKASTQLFLCTTPYQRAALRSWILEGVSNEPVVRKRAGLWSELLTQRDVQIHQEASGGLGKCVLEMIGRDDGSDEYRGSLMRTVTPLIPKYEPYFRDAAKAIASEIVAQKPCAFYLRDCSSVDNIRARMDSREAVIATNAAANSAALLISEAGKTEKRAEATIKFLCSPLSIESMDAFRETAQRMGVTMYSPIAAGLSATGVKRYVTDDEMAIVERQSLSDFHDYFWSLSVEERSFLVKQVLINPSRLFDNAERTHDHARTLVLDQLFPPGRFPEGSVDERNATWAREILYCFLESIHETERGFMLAAMLSVAQQNSGGSFSPGRTLRLLFENLGPAYVKLGQAMHSYPGTPEEIRVELKDLKGHAEAGARWETIERVEEVLPEQLRASIEYIGPVLGSASFNITLSMRQGGTIVEEKALSLLRRHARARAIKGYDDLTGAVDLLAERRPEFAPYKRDALAILRHSRQLTEIETDPIAGAAQSICARSLYDGVRVLSDGILFSVETAHWLEYGEEYKTMPLCKGVHFDELPETTEEERAFKKAVAKALLAVELKHILAGRHFDCDRHEAQCRIDGNKIWILDHGGMSTELPTAQDKVALGETIARVMEGIQKGDEMEAAVQAAFSGVDESDFICRVRRGLLALTFDFQQLSPNEVISILATLDAHGFVDSTIQRTAADSIPAMRNLRRRTWFAGPLRPLLASKSSGVLFKRRDQIDMSQPVYWPREQASP